jgi:phosphoglycolate phosphatase-like HAD superfamily hydrolase
LSLLLFDIDGTLLLSGGAGVRAMTHAFEQVFGVSEAFATSDMAGRTDTFILSNALVHAGLPDSVENHRRFREAYIALLGEKIQQPGKGRRGLMPGILPLLEALRQRAPFHLALLTGNFERAAHIKLGHFGIDAFFEWGVFGEESAERNELGRVALGRAEERAVPRPACERAIIIGDTPHDVACARSIGARCLAVATGSYTVDELTHAGADVTLADLSDTELVLSILP